MKTIKKNKKRVIMRTTRSFKYFMESHCLCAPPTECKIKVNVKGDTYCEDKTGKKSDYCICAIKAVSNLESLAWVVKFNSWKDLTVEVRKRNGLREIEEVKWKKLKNSF